MKKPIVILTCATILIGAVSCKKPDTAQPQTVPNISKGDYKRGDFVFSLANLRKTTIARSITGSGRQLVPSHLYVRFKPVTQQHIDAIEKNNIPTYPYPLATDSLDVSNPDYSKLYTFLPIRKTLPDCPYDVLDTVMMLKPETAGVAQAYAAAGRKYNIIGSSGSGTVSRTVNDDGFEPSECDQWDENDGPQTEEEEECFECGDCGGTYVPPPNPPSNPPAPSDPADSRSTPFTVTYNSCSMNTDDNYPSGRITVEETQWGNGGIAYEGVSDVKVVILGPNGQRVVAQTNRYGCFKATGAIRGFRLFGEPVLPVIMNVQFVSDRKEIRGINNVMPTAPSQYGEPLLHIYDDISDRMNNADLSYERNTSVNSDDAKYYVAATVNNALYEFDEYAAQDGIMPPPDGIKILVHNFHSSASAPMFAALADRNPLSNVEMQYFLLAKTGAFGAPLLTALPDVLFGYSWNNGETFSTDRIKETAYHEFSHASHYRKTSADFWTDNIKFVVDYGILSSTSYGHAGDPGVEKTDLVEMWGYFMGREYAHRRYGPTRHSILSWFNYTPAETNTVFRNSWYARNELIQFESEHIPAGFLHDICDNNVYNGANNLFDNIPAPGDNIQGYSITTIFNQLDGSTTSAASLINKLGNLLPSGANNTTANYNALRNAYGY